MFDMPVIEKNQRQNYNRFKKFLVQNGYHMFQESVYIKLLRNISNTQKEIVKIESISSLEGNVQVLPMSLLNFKKMTSICGTAFDIEFFSDDVVCI